MNNNHPTSNQPVIVGGIVQANSISSQSLSNLTNGIDIDLEEQLSKALGSNFTNYKEFKQVINENAKLRDELANLYFLDSTKSYVSKNVIRGLSEHFDKKFLMLTQISDTDQTGEKFSAKQFRVTIDIYNLEDGYHAFNIVSGPVLPEYFYIQAAQFTDVIQNALSKMITQDGVQFEQIIHEDVHTLENSIISRQGNITLQSEAVSQNRGLVWSSGGKPLDLVYSDYYDQIVVLHVNRISFLNTSTLSTERELWLPIRGSRFFMIGSTIVVMDYRKSFAISPNGEFKELKNLYVDIVNNPMGGWIGYTLSGEIINLTIGDEIKEDLIVSMKDFDYFPQIPDIAEAISVNSGGYALIENNITTICFDLKEKKVVWNTETHTEGDSRLITEDFCLLVNTGLVTLKNIYSAKDLWSLSIPGVKAFEYDASKKEIYILSSRSKITTVNLDGEIINSYERSATKISSPLLTALEKVPTGKNHYISGRYITKFIVNGDDFLSLASSGINFDLREISRISKEDCIAVAKAFYLSSGRDVPQSCLSEDDQSIYSPNRFGVFSYRVDGDYPQKFDKVASDTIVTNETSYYQGASDIECFDGKILTVSGSGKIHVMDKEMNLIRKISIREPLPVGFKLVQDQKRTTIVLNNHYDGDTYIYDEVSNNFELLFERELFDETSFLESISRDGLKLYLCYDSELIEFDLSNKKVVKSIPTPKHRYSSSAVFVGNYCYYFSQHKLYRYDLNQSSSESWTLIGEYENTIGPDIFIASYRDSVLFSNNRIFTSGESSQIDIPLINTSKSVLVNGDDLWVFGEGGSVSLFNASQIF